MPAVCATSSTTPAMGIPGRQYSRNEVYLVTYLVMRFLLMCNLAIRLLSKSTELPPRTAINGSPIKRRLKNMLHLCNPKGKVRQEAGPEECGGQISDGVEQEHS